MSFAMNHPPEAKSSRRSNGCNNNVVEFVPEELIAEVISYLSVKSLMQLRCVCKSWDKLISHPKFIKQHLQIQIQQSKLNKNNQILCVSPNAYILPFPLNTLLNNPSLVKSAIKSQNLYFPPKSKYDYRFIGTCNGLFGFLVLSYMTRYPQDTWFRIWNPATNTLSPKFGERTHSVVSRFSLAASNGDYLRSSGFSFGYDSSTDTYKIVYFRPNKFEIFTFGGNDWKIIQLPRFVPLNHMTRVPQKRIYLNEDVYLKDTINFLARDVSAQQIVIISLNLSTDTYCMLLSPQDFVQDSLHLPTIHALEDSLCFSHHTQNTHFIIWKMTEFGIQDSWTQFFKISYHNLDVRIEPKYHFLAPLCLYESGIALVQATHVSRLQVILYNWSENTIENITMLKSTKWLLNQNYVESLAPTGSTKPRPNFKHIRRY